MSTGEETPTGQSLAARMILLPVGKGDVRFDTQLGVCQEHGAAGMYAKTMSGFPEVVSTPVRADFSGYEG